MGDLVNYYIDRIANESYILTATQRESLLNIASMYGYKPANYVPAYTTLNISSTQGYNGQLGGAIIESGVVDGLSITAATGNGTTITYTANNSLVAGQVISISGLGTASGASLNLSNVNVQTANSTQFTVTSSVTGVSSGTGYVTLGNFLKVIVPNNNPFSNTTAPYNTIVVNSVPSKVTGTVGDTAVSYSSGVFNGTFPVSFVGYDTYGTNVVWYRPAALISGVSVSTASLTSASSTGTVITYVGTNSFVVGQIVTITGFSTDTYNFTSAKIASVAVDGSSFTVTSSAASSGNASGTGTATDTGFTISLTEAGRTLSPRAGERILIRGSIVGSGYGYNGNWVVLSSTDATDSTPMKAIITTQDTYTTPSITKAIAAFSSTGTVGTVAGSGPYTAAITGMANTTSFYVGQIINATSGTGNFGSGVVTVASVVSSTSITVSSTTTFSAGTVTAIRGAYYRYSIWSDSVFTQGLTAGQTVTVTGITTTSGTSPYFNLSNSTVYSVADIEAAVSRTKATVNGGSYDYTYYVSRQFSAGDVVTLRDISSGVTPSGAANLGFNLTNVEVSNTSATTTASIQNVTGNTSGNGTITYETTADPAVGHGFKVGDFVTITGITNDTNASTSKTNVYNLSSAKILAIGGSGANPTTFTVRGYWTNTYTSIQPGGNGTATSYAFTVLSAGATDTATSTGSAISKYFKLPSGSTNPGTWSSGSGALATPQVSGTWSSGGEVVYSEIPTLVLNGPTVNTNTITTVPSGTQVSTQVTVDGVTKDVVFSTLYDLPVPEYQTESVLAVHGEDISLRADNAANTSAKAYDIAGELLGYSSGDADQAFALKETEVSPRSVRVFVDTGVQWEEWLQVEHVQDYDPTSKIFEVTVAADQTVSVVFGDGVSGKIPTKESGIKAVYFSGGGTYGNVSSGTLTSWRYVPGTYANTIRNNMTVTNPNAATGGADPESNDSIRYNSPRSLRALNRAVTIDDFANLALSVDGIVKANAYAKNRSSVTVYVAPHATDSSDTTPGTDEFGAPTPSMTAYKQYVYDYLSDKVQIGTTTTVLEPTYNNVYVAINYSSLPQYNSGIVETAIKTAILNDFSYDNVTFEDVITPEEIEFKLRQVEGVSNVKVTGLYRVGGSGRNSLIGDPSEIFVFTGSNIGLTNTHSLALLSSVTFAPYLANGTTTNGSITSLTPSGTGNTINSSVFTYSLVLPVNTGQLKVSSTTNDTNLATVSVNDNVATWNVGTSAYDFKLTTIPATKIYITVTAQDGITTNTYQFKVTVASS
jgi:hypothetical protein